MSFAFRGLGLLDPRSNQLSYTSYSCFSLPPLKLQTLVCVRQDCLLNYLTMAVTEPCQQPAHFCQRIRRLPFSIAMLFWSTGTGTNLTGLRALTAKCLSLKFGAKRNTVRSISSPCFGCMPFVWVLDVHVLVHSCFATLAAALASSFFHSIFVLAFPCGPGDVQIVHSLNGLIYHRQEP